MLNDDRRPLPGEALIYVKFRRPPLSKSCTRGSHKRVHQNMTLGLHECMYRPYTFSHNTRANLIFFVSLSVVYRSLKKCAHFSPKKCVSHVRNNSSTQWTAAGSVFGAVVCVFFVFVREIYRAKFTCREDVFGHWLGRV